MPCLSRCGDRPRNFHGTGLMHPRQNMAVIVRHDCVDRPAGSDLLAADHDGNVDLPTTQVLERLLELGALAGAWRVGKNGLVQGGRNLRRVHWGNVTGEPLHVLEMI